MKPAQDEIQEEARSDLFVFRKHDSVGAAAAEDDAQYLDSCFVDTGDLVLLKNCENSKRIVVGRTGSGKSALIRQLSRTNAHVISLSPHDLSLNFIATNKVIAFFEAAGVNLTPFYILLWKHLLVVELLKAKFNIVNESSHKEFMGTLKSMLYKKDRYKEQALDYLEQWGNKFWLTTEQRIHELTERVENNLSGSVKAGLSKVNFSAEGARTLTTEQRQEITEHGQDAVSRIQIRELNNMIEVLADNVFDDPKDRHYVTIDMLDEDWADERIKFKLIRALIEVVRSFKAVPNVKVILAIRQDLLDKVTNLEPIPGFQEEKYRSLCLNLQWNRKDLASVVERRINQLIKRHYTKGDLAFTDVFPTNVDGKDTLDYMLERTFQRPRDIIVFTNECIELAAGRPKITTTIIKAAEERYSAERIQSLGYEWNTILPHLTKTARVFNGMKDHFAVSEITEQFLVDRYSEFCDEIPDANADPIARSLSTLCSDRGNFNSIRNLMLREFFVTGLIGIKSGPTDSVNWSRMTGHAKLNAGEVRASSIVYVHPMFYRVLGIRYRH